MNIKDNSNNIYNLTNILCVVLIFEIFTLVLSKCICKANFNYV